MKAQEFPPPREAYRALGKVSHEGDCDMLTLAPALQALLYAQDTGWTRTWPHWGRSRWTHADGRACTLQKGRGGVWKLALSRPYSAIPRAMSLDIPRTAKTLGTDFGPVLHDIQAWTKGLDLEPRGRIAHTVAAWLTAQGRTETFTITLFDISHEHALIRPMIQGHTHQFRATAALQDFLEDDIRQMWTLHRTPPDSSPHPKSVRRGDGCVEYRTIGTRAPASAHERMVLLSQARPEIFLIPVPGPITDFTARSQE